MSLDAKVAKETSGAKVAKETSRTEVPIKNPSAKVTKEAPIKEPSIKEVVDKEPSAKVAKETVIKPKRKCSQKQLEALAAGRAKNSRFKPKVAGKAAN